MAIRIPWAYDPHRNSIRAHDVDPDGRCEFYSCPKCDARLNFTKAHDKQVGDDLTHVSAYFKLWPKHDHSDACSYNLTEQIKVIARSSEEAGEYLAKPPRAKRYRFRLMALPPFGKGDGLSPNEPQKIGRPPAKNPNFQLSHDRLPAYLSTAKRILDLRLMCEGNPSMEDVLDLTYGRKILPWSDVCFESDAFLHGFGLIAAKAEHPMAFVGEVKLTRIEEDEGGKWHWVHLKPFRSKRSADRIVTSVEPRMKTRKAFFVDGIKEGDVIAAFGHWNAWTPPDPSKDGGTTFINHYLYMIPHRKDQLATEPVQ